MTLWNRIRLSGWLAITALGGLTTVAVAVDKDKPAPAAKLSAVELDQKIMAEIKDRSEIMKNLGYISDVIGHRLTGSASLKRANEWTAEVMKSYGLENVHLEPWEIPIGWQRGHVTMTLKTPREQVLLACSAGWSPSTNGKVTGPVVVLDVTKKEDLEKYRGKLKNAIVLQARPSTVPAVKDAVYRRPAQITPPATTPPAAPPMPKPGEAAVPPVPTTSAIKDGDDQPPAAPTTPAAPAPAGNQPPRRGGFGEGGLGLMQAVSEFLKEEGVAATLRDSGKPHGLLVTTGSWRGTDGKAPADGTASLFVAHEHYALLYRLGKEMKDNPPMVELEVKNTFVPGPVTVYNTVGEVRGSEKPDEVVVVGAHLDSWDLASGTTDNGTGSSVTLECARVIAKLAKEGNGPKRTVRFVLFSGEEQGLHGSKQYCIRHKDELAKHSAALVHDTGTGKVLNFGMLGREACKKILDAELTSLKAVEFEGLTIGGMRGGTDHYSFHLEGVPGFACGQDPEEYLFTHHTQSDTFDKAKHPNLIQGAQVFAVSAVRIANLPEMLPREKLSEGGGGGGGRGGAGGARPNRPTTPPAPPAEAKPLESKRVEEKKPPLE